MSDFQPGTRSREGASTLSAAYFGVSSLLLRTPTTTVLIDGYFSRPESELLHVGAIRPDEKRIDAALDRAGIDELDAVVAVHTHIDHALDAPVIARKLGAALVGSDSLRTLGRSFGVDEQSIIVVADRSVLTVGDVAIEFAEVPHCPGDVAPGDITEPLVMPAPARSWKSGTCFGLRITHGSRSLVLQASANYVARRFDDWQATTVLLGIGKLAEQGSAFIDEYWRHAGKATGATVVGLVHWDDFTRPLTDVAAVIPDPASDDVGSAARRIDDLVQSALPGEPGRQRHAELVAETGRTVGVPPLWTPFDPFDPAALERPGELFEVPEPRVRMASAGARSGVARTAPE